MTALMAEIRFRPGTVFTALPGGSVRLRNREGLCVLEGANAFELIRRLAPALQEGCFAERLVEHLQPAQQAKVFELLERLDASRILESVAAQPPPLHIALWAPECVQARLATTLERAGHTLEVEPGSFRRSDLRIAVLGGTDEASLQRFAAIRALGDCRFIGAAATGAIWLGPRPGLGSAFTPEQFVGWRKTLPANADDSLGPAERRLAEAWLAHLIAEALTRRHSWPPLEGMPVPMLAFDPREPSTFETLLASTVQGRDSWQTDLAVNGILALSNARRASVPPNDDSGKRLEAAVEAARLFGGLVAELGERDDIQLPLCRSHAVLRDPVTGGDIHGRGAGLSYDQARRRALDSALAAWAERASRAAAVPVRAMIRLPDLALTDETRGLAPLGVVLADNWSSLLVKAVCLWTARFEPPGEEDAPLAFGALDRNVRRLWSVAAREAVKSVILLQRTASNGLMAISARKDGRIFIGVGVNPGDAAVEALLALHEGRTEGPVEIRSAPSPADAMRWLDAWAHSLVLEPMPPFGALTVPVLAARVHARCPDVDP
jgi:hypothetical protein